MNATLTGAEITPASDLRRLQQRGLTDLLHELQDEIEERIAAAHLGWSEEAFRRALCRSLATTPIRDND